MYVPNFFFRAFSYLPPDRFLKCFFLSGWENLRATLFSALADTKCGGICRCGGRRKNICWIKGLNYCTKFSKFHMALRNTIVPARNKETHSSEGVKDNLGHSHNRICKSQWTIGNSLHWPWSECTVWPNNGNIDFNAQRILVELSKLSGTEGEYRSLSFPWGAKRVISVSAAPTHPFSVHPAMISCWKLFSQTNKCKCPENSATSSFCPLPSCYTAIGPDIICTIVPCWQCIETETGVFWELMLHWCPVAMGPRLRHEVMTFLFGHIVTYWVDTNYPDSLSTNLAAGSGQGSHSPIHGTAFEVTATTVRL